MKVHVGEETFRITKDGSILGEVHFEHDGDMFPTPPWTDFAVVIVGWWLEALEAGKAGGGTELNFMDGPYEVEVEFQEEGRSRVSWIERTRLGPVTRKTFHVSTNELVDAVSVAGRSVLKVCSDHNWASGDVAALRRGVSRTRGQPDL